MLVAAAVMAIRATDFSALDVLIISLLGFANGSGANRVTDAVRMPQVHGEVVSRV
jgi:hypothetical protein